VTEHGSDDDRDDDKDDDRKREKERHESQWRNREQQWRNVFFFSYRDGVYETSFRKCHDTSERLFLTLLWGTRPASSEASR
jgi:hypothetical protein